MAKKLHRRSLAWFAILVLVVIVFSYLLSIAIAFACATLPLVLILNGFGGFGIAILAVVGPVIALTILWSLLPRRDKFSPPGVPLVLETQPRLKALIEQVAACLNERVPRELYLTAEANAFVTVRNSVLGFGGERVMGLGLPLLAGLSVSEFRAVLAHEFAHYYSGDTSLGPRIYSTRAAMARTLQNLSSDSVIKDVLSRFGIALLLHTVVVGMLLAYWKVFLRITQLVSRKQEHRSDELACYVAGSRSMAEGLKRINMMSAISRSFWPSVMNPVLSAGFRPPIADGFRRYYSAPPIERAASAFLQDLLDNPKTTAYDTHPPLKSRLDQIGRISVEGDFPSDNSPAISLLDDVDGLESRLLGFLLSGHEGTLRTVDWESTSSTVWLPLWRSYLNEHSASLAKYTLESIPSALKELPAIGSTMRDPPGTLLTREQRAERASDLICTALTVRLVDQGWELRMQPGEFSIVKGEAVASPPGLIRDLRAGKKSQDDWREWCRTNGLETVSLGQEASVAGPM